MAFRLRHWLGLTAAGGGAVALLLVPPTSWEGPQERVRLHEDARVRALTDDAQDAASLLLHLRLSDSLVALTLAHQASEELPFATGTPPGTDPLEASLVLDRARLEADALPLGKGSPALGLFFVPSGAKPHPGAPRVGIDDLFYAGVRDGREYCVAVVNTWRSGLDGPVRISGVPNNATRFGLCAWVVRFGLPGEAVTKWMRNGATSMAGVQTPVTTMALREHVDRRGRVERRAPLGFFAPMEFFGSLPLEGEQCVAGNMDGCAQVLFQPARQWYGNWGDRDAPRYDRLHAHTPLLATQAHSIFPFTDRLVAADLLHQFGEERFRRFWTADGDPKEAFRDAFGVDGGAWYADRVAAYVRVSPAGPRPRLAGLVGGVLLLTLSTTVAGAWARRRQVA